MQTKTFILNAINYLAALVYIVYEQNAILLFLWIKNVNINIYLHYLWVFKTFNF